MKVTAFNGSPHAEGNTAILVRRVFVELEKAGIETELVHVGGRALHGCKACNACWKRKDGRCSIDDDPMNGWIGKMRASDGIILASPTYFSDVSTEMKALIDRAGMVSRACGDLFARKVGAGVVAVRRGGEIHAFDTLNHFFLIGQMIVPGSIYWNMGFGRAIGEVEGDEEGLRTMEMLGTNMAWLMGRIAGA